MNDSSSSLAHVHSKGLPEVEEETPTDDVIQVPGLITDESTKSAGRKSGQRIKSSKSNRAATGRSKLSRAATPAGVRFAEANSSGEESVLDSDYDTDLEIEELREEFDPTGRKAYRDACKHLGIVPVSFVLEHITDEALDIKHHGLGPSGAKAVAIALMNNTTTTKVNLCDCAIGPEGGENIAKLLKENFYVTEIDVSHNKVQTQGCIAFCEALNENTIVQSLSLGWSELKNKDAVPLSDMMKNNHALKTLDLSGNGFEEEAGLHFGPSIDANDTLESLNLSWNHLRGKGAISIGKGLRANVSLKFLDLSWNGFADDGAAAVGESLRENNTLVELDISNNRISTKGALRLSEGLKINNTLKILRCGMNPIQNAGANAILSAMKNNVDSAMERLCLNKVVIDTETKSIVDHIIGMRPYFAITCTLSNCNGNLADELDALLGGMSRKKKLAELLNRLVAYIDRMNYRMVDLFNQFDKDKSMSVSREEFYTGLKSIGVPMDNQDITLLINLLDDNGDGEIDYSEFVAIRDVDEDDINATI